MSVPMRFKLTLKRAASLDSTSISLDKGAAHLVVFNRTVSVPSRPLLLETKDETPYQDMLAAEADIHSEKTIETRRCLICLEDKAAAALRSCGRYGCAGAFCPSCLASYFEERVSASRFALPPMTCAECRHRIPTDAWRSYVDEATFERYEQNALDLLTLRCPDCDSMVSIGQAYCSHDVGKAIRCFLARCRDAHAVRQAWSSFEEGQTGADDFLDVLCSGGPSDLKDVEMELRVDENGGVYSQEQFLKWYDYEDDDGYNGDSWDDHDSGASDFGSHAIDDAEVESMLSTGSGCLVCGCIPGLDHPVDRVCFCDSCQLSGCSYREKGLNGNECLVCGCSAGLDSVCWCDSCQTAGCSFADLNSNENCECQLEGRPDTHEGCESAKSGIRECCNTGGGDIEESSDSQFRGLQMWGNSTTWCPSKRRAGDGWQYSLAEFEVFYGATRGREIWEDMPVANIEQVLHLFADLERRTALHLACLRRWPRIRTPCCNSEYCFRCQMGWHHDETCEEIALSATVDVQFCPGCQVPTQRTEGCSSMVCLCGTHWDWDGDDDGDADYWDSDDDSDGDY